MSKLVVILLAIFLSSLSPIYAEDIIAKETEYTSDRDNIANIFTNKADEVVTTSTCKFSCRAVADGYIARIVDIDSQSGTTYCEVYSSHDFTKSLQISASQVNTKCRDDANTLYSGSLSSNKTMTDFNKAEYNSDKITFSRFLGALVTLDSEVININSTINTGLLTLNNPNAVYGTSAVINNSNSLFGESNAELISSADSINKANLGYYATLFSDMNEVYTYLQNFLFIMIGAFFIFKVGGSKLLNYLEKNEQTEKDYLKRFAIPVISVAIFFAPIPQANNTNTTIIQNLIRYFTQTSISIADRASNIGVNSYLKFLYNSVGYQTTQGEQEIRDIFTQAKAQESQYKSVIEYCKIAYPYKLTYNNKYLNGVDSSGSFDLNSKASVITPEACNKIEYKMLLAQKQRRIYENYTNTITDNFQNGNLDKILQQINTDINTKQSELGFANALIVPSAALMINTIGKVSSATQSMQNIDDNNEKIISQAEQNADKDIIDSSITLAGQRIGWIFDGVPYFMLPGVSGIYQFFQSGFKSIGGVMQQLPNPLFKIGSLGVQGVGSSASYFATVFIVKNILEYLPLITAMVCGVIVFVGFIVDLAIYFYISPFVVVYSMTTRNTHKIIEFLVNGLAIFFKPILIVILVFFALALYHLVNDVFLGFATNQFAVLSSINTEFFTAIFLAIIHTMIKILGIIASIFIMWYIIVRGVGIVYKHIGLGDTASTAESLTQKLERYSVQV